MPDNIDPLLFWGVLFFSAAFLGGGLYSLWRTLRVRRSGMPTLFKIVDFEIHVASEGEAYPPIYEVLEGPRKGDIVRSAAISSPSSVTVLNAGTTDSHTEKLKAKIGQQRSGWVHATDDIGMSIRDTIVHYLITAFLLIVGGFAASFVINWLMG